MNSVLVGLVGKNIQQSGAPRLHEAEADAQGIRLIYRLIDTSEIGPNAAGPADILDAAELLCFAGLNVTHPYKQQILPLLSDLSDDAGLAGAVNTVVFKNGRRIGHNTDLYGFEKAFECNLGAVAKYTCLQLGAGGAGGATAIALLRLGVKEVRIFDTDAKKASKLVDRLSAEFGSGRAVAIDDVANALRDADGLVNTTPVGMAEYPGSPVPLESIRSSLWVADIIYFPWQTTLLRLAESQGCTVMNGGDMAVYQAAQAFDLFTGKRADRMRMRESFRKDCR